MLSCNVVAWQANKPLCLCANLPNFQAYSLVCSLPVCPFRPTSLQEITGCFRLCSFGHMGYALRLCFFHQLIAFLEADKGLPIMEYKLGTWDWVYSGLAKILLCYNRFHSTFSICELSNVIPPVWNWYENGKKLWSSKLFKKIEWFRRSVVSSSINFVVLRMQALCFSSQFVRQY